MLRASSRESWNGAFARPDRRCDLISSTTFRAAHPLAVPRHSSPQQMGKPIDLLQQQISARGILGVVLQASIAAGAQSPSGQAPQIDQVAARLGVDVDVDVGGARTQW